MGCFIGCLGGDKDRKQPTHRSSPQRRRRRRQRSKFQNVVHQESAVVLAGQLFDETITSRLVHELRTDPEVLEHRSSPVRSPKKRVTFNSNITIYEHVSVHGSVDSLPECPANIEKENLENSITKEDNSVVGLYPSNHRYHNAARDSDDETEEFGDSDLEDFDDEDEDDDYGYDYEDEYIDDESVLAPSVESRTENPSRHDLSDSVERPMMLGSKANARDRSDYINSVLNPVENTTQWKAVKSKVEKIVSIPQKENLTAAANFKLVEANFKEIAVDASLSNWLGSSDITSSAHTSQSSDGRTGIIRVR